VAKSKSVHIERALFVVGDPNAGKSVQLRSMFCDWRLGTKGIIPTTNNIPDRYVLSNERWLYLRLTSPHEMKETPKKFLDTCEKKMQTNRANARRWNFAGAIQPSAANKMPDALTTISNFVTRFEPERVRAILLHPDWQGHFTPQQDLEILLAGLQASPQTEVILTDARTRTGNGLIYADFFDFT
jgi:hypothetical protein